MKRYRGVPHRPQGGGKAATITTYLTMKPEEPHPIAMADGKIYTHRMVLYEKLGAGQHPCHWCGKHLVWVGAGSKLVSDHLDANKWNNEPDNLVPACTHCNRARMLNPRFLTHCMRGHEWTPGNIYPRPDGNGRNCRACIKIRIYRRSKRRHIIDETN